MTIVFYEQVYPDEMKRQRQWKEMAKKMGVEVRVDEDLERERMARALAAVHADFMGD